MTSLTAWWTPRDLASWLEERGLPERGLSQVSCRERQHSFADGFGRKEQRLSDVVSLEVGVQREDTLCGVPFSYEGNDNRNGNPKTAKTRNSPHLAGIGRDPLELHIDSVARRAPTLVLSQSRRANSASTCRLNFGDVDPLHRHHRVHRALGGGGSAPFIASVNVPTSYRAGSKSSIGLLSGSSI